jgi:hypothetical protein
LNSIYVAGGFLIPSHSAIPIITNKLFSFYHSKEYRGSERRLFLEFLKRRRDTIGMNKVNLFLDSGAFSAWTQGVSIDIYEYIDFIKEHLDVLEVYANLDVIGLGGKQPNRLTAEKTLENQKIMEEAGLNPLPCFHFGEPFEYLQYYVDNYDYLALGVAGNTGNKLIPWLDECFGNYICGEDGMPKIKIHGFAVTSLKAMLRYPFYSVDSTSWVMTSRMGSIYVPRYRGGNWLYDENSWKVAVSSRSPGKTDAGKHIDTFPPRHKQVILDYLQEKGYQLGKSRFEKFPQTHELKDNERWAEKKPKDKGASRLLEIIEEEGVSNRYQLRDEMNIIYFQDLEKSMPPWPWAFKPKGLKGFSL